MEICPLSVRDFRYNKTIFLFTFCINDNSVSTK